MPGSIVQTLLELCQVCEHWCALEGFYSSCAWQARKMFSAYKGLYEAQHPNAEQHEHTAHSAQY